MAADGAGSGEALFFVPLGGAGEIGMNLNVYGIGRPGREQWIIADLGMTFADESLPGVDLVLPDPTWIEDRRDDLLAIVLTHAHEDHLGAVAGLWQRLGCPVYASPFTAAVLRRKLDEAGLTDDVPLHIVRDGGAFEIGPFRVSMIGITHSLPEAKSLAIETALGTVLHSGDWKLDPNPLVGDTTDEAAYQAWGDKGILALVCDSTNVFNPGSSGSEGTVRENLTRLVGGCRGRVAITTFASNVARIATVAAAAAAHDRHLVVVGRSLWRFIEAGRETGYLDEIGPILPDREAGYLPRDKVLLLCTGCQGEPRGAMTRIAEGGHPQVTLESGDTVIFSSKIIPGNERTLGRLHNLLALADVEVITEKDDLVHVSGHPARDELAAMYAWIRPEIAVPVHGEARHLRHHVRLARELGVAHAAGVLNGDKLRLAPGRPEIVEQVPVGRLALDGGELVEIGSAVLQSRRKLMYNGAAQVTLVLDDAGGLAAEPRIALIGVVDGVAEAELGAEVAAALREELDRRAKGRDDDKIAEAARRVLRRVVRRACGRRPVTEVQVVRLPGAGSAPTAQSEEQVS